MRLLSRKEAKQNGKYLYYTGQPCKHGHIAERYTNNAMCIVCSKKYSAEQVESPETKRARYLRNRDSLLENKKRYYKKNRKEIRTKQKKYRDENHDRILEINRQWAKNNPEKVRENWNLYRYRKHRAVPAWLTDEDKAKIREIYSRCKEMTEQTGIQHHVDHIIPIHAKKASGLHVPENLQIVPASYNLSKKNSFEAGTLVIAEAE